MGGCVGVWVGARLGVFFGACAHVCVHDCIVCLFAHVLGVDTVSMPASDLLAIRRLWIEDRETGALDHSLSPHLTCACVVAPVYVGVGFRSVPI